ncbi:MAG: hypothetical protein IJP90_14790 [Treponema sp.]|nr:hypothetical protein [Treponema sp.]
MTKMEGLEINQDEIGRIIFKLFGDEAYYMVSNEKHFLIIDSSYFDKQWKKSSFKIQKILANIENKKNDYKYNKAEKGFSFGEKNPVPVVDVFLEVDNNDIIPTLNDGLTRTNYLLSKNVKKLVFSINENIKLKNTKSYQVINIHSDFC